MGIGSGTSTGWLFVHCVLIELEFRDVGFWGEGKTGVPREKPLEARTRTNNKLDPHLMPSPGLEPGPHWWEASALTTAPSLLPLKERQMHEKDHCRVWLACNHGSESKVRSSTFWKLLFTNTERNLRESFHWKCSTKYLTNIQTGKWL